MDLKKPIAINEQIHKLSEHGIIISDRAFAEDVICRVGYYRLSGYMLQFRSERDKTSVTFEQIYNIYCFDEELRAILRNYVEKIEVFYKSLIGNIFALLKCSEPPYLQHYDIDNYYDKKVIKKTLIGFEKEKEHYRNSNIVRHHKSKYGDKMPLWVMMEFMTFSGMSMFYHSLYLSDKESIADKVGISSQTLENHLHCLSVLRNRCAHGVRLYNNQFNPPARFTKAFLRAHQKISNLSLFAYVLVLLKRLPANADRQEFSDMLHNIIEKYGNDIDLSQIGFPRNYREIMNISNLRLRQK